MNATQLEAVLVKVAKSDIARARKYGSHLVGQTKVGTVQITKTSFGFELAECTHGTVFAHGPAALVAKALAACYVVAS